MNDSLRTHGALTERSCTSSLRTPIGKGREGKGVRKGRGSRALRILNYRSAPTPGARSHRPSHAAMRRCAARVGGGR